MSITYFPFTHITYQACRTLTAFFSGFQYLDIEKTGKPGKNTCKGDESMVPLRLPRDMIQKADHLFSQYREWAEIHQGSENTLKILLQENPYFTEDSHVTAIKSRLKNAGPAKQDTDPVLVFQHQLLFLKTADTRALFSQKHLLGERCFHENSGYRSAVFIKTAGGLRLLWSIQSSHEGSGMFYTSSGAGLTGRRLAFLMASAVCS